jgi:hypothetical protein
MSKKYVIEIKPEYEDTTKGVMVLGARESNLYVDTLSIEDLEELNSDYINEHFGELQDEAYQRGLEDAWEAARKIIRMPDGDILDLFPDCYASVCTAVQAILKYDASEAIAKLKAYEGNKDEPIKAGDIVERYVDGKLDSKGIYLQEDGGYWRCLFYTGAIFMTFAYPKGQFKKTGKHYDIQSILEAMRE